MLLTAIRASWRKFHLWGFGEVGGCSEPWKRARPFSKHGRRQTVQHDKTIVLLLTMRDNDNPRMLQQCNLLTLCEELRLSAIYIASRPRKSQYSTCTNIIPLIVLTTKSFAAATKTEKYSTIGSMKLPYEVAAGSGTLCYKSFIRCFIACRVLGLSWSWRDVNGG